MVLRDRKYRQKINQELQMISKLRIERKRKLLILS